MTKTELIKRLQAEVEESGDMHILSFRMVDEEATSGRHMMAPDLGPEKTRRNKRTGLRARMNLKEFREYIKSNPIKQDFKPSELN